MTSTHSSPLAPAQQCGIVVLYDGACKTCIEDRQRYESWQQTTTEKVHWLDLNQAPEVLKYFNISYNAAIAELHLIIDGSQVIKELDAYILLFQQISKYHALFRLLAWLIGLPLIKPCLSKYYRYRVNKDLHAQDDYDASDYLC